METGVVQLSYLLSLCLLSVWSVLSTRPSDRDIINLFLSSAQRSAASSALVDCKNCSHTYTQPYAFHVTLDFFVFYTPLSPPVSIFLSASNLHASSSPRIVQLQSFMHPDWFVVCPPRWVLVRAASPVSATSVSCPPSRSSNFVFILVLCLSRRCRWSSLVWFMIVGRQREQYSRHSFTTNELLFSMGKVVLVGSG
jgi:hypothetical protein